MREPAREKKKNSDRQRGRETVWHISVKKRGGVRHTAFERKRTGTTHVHFMGKKRALVLLGKGK